MLYTKSTGLKYIGGKHYIKKHIINRLDYSKSCYVELFGGVAHVLLSKPKHKVEIYNDINDDLVNLFLVLKENYNEFLKETEWDIYSETLFKKYRDDLKNNNLNNIERAHRFFYVLCNSFAGMVQDFGYSFYKDRNLAKIYLSSIEKLKYIHNRLKNVIILNKDFRDLLNSVKDNNDVMIYADPPYFGKEDYYNCEFTIKDHEDLAMLLNECKGNILLSYYYFDGIEDLYSKTKWNYEEIKAIKHSYGITKNSKNDKKPEAIELIIANYKYHNSIF